MHDDGTVGPDHVRMPVWMIRTPHVAVNASAMGGGCCAAAPGPEPATTVTTVERFVDMLAVIDDASGSPMVSRSDTPDDPPVPWTGGPPKPQRAASCPEDLSTYKPGVVDDGATLLPTGVSGVLTQPRATLRASNGDAYDLEGGAGSFDQPASSNGAGDGVLLVVHHPADPCKTTDAHWGAVTFQHEPSHTGAVTITGIAGDAVRYRTAGGVSGSYDVVRARSPAEGGLRALHGRAYNYAMARSRFLARRVTRARSCCVCSAGTPTSRSRTPPATAPSARSSPTAIRAWPAAYPDLVYEAVDVDQAAAHDLVFLALPHGASGAVVPQLVGRVEGIVDLGADFRLKDAALYPTWYGEEHPAPELLPRFAARDPGAVPRRDRGEEAGRGRRLLSHRGGARTRAADQDRSSSSRPASSSTPRPAFRAPARCQSRTPTSTRSTRTSPPTDC